MKKTTAIAMALVLCMMFGGAALAENPSVTEIPVVTEITQEGEPLEAEEANPFLQWIGQGLELVEDQVTAGWNTVTETVTAGWDTVVGQVTGWADAVENYLTEKKLAWDAETSEAWNTLKEGAEHQGEIAQEKLDAAYTAIRDWLIQAGDTVDQRVAQAVDAMAGAAGVVDAQVSGWYRTVETFMVQNSEKVTESVQDAWNTVEQSVTGAGNVAAEKLSEACETIRTWMSGLTDVDTSEATEAIDGLESSL